ncbi:TM2 domain-containing protein [Pandoraea anhela]|uniref:TM2 domain-containing protein n=1 Tax=Pandoraea anhela TaxID=2508295 RepID=A0A5E4XKC7_9BURK|nr:TM2 domain-containing protein [Pandoraea anhela]VVE36734.1 hypothetical protein PAN31108_03926 [Pandoraea anhela]
MDQSTIGMMQYDASKKSSGIAYLLWFFFGGLGGHRFYAKRTGTAVAQLVLWIVGLSTIFLGGLGVFILGALYIWVVVDAFLIPGLIRSYNLKLAAQVAAPSATMAATNAL